VEEEATARMEAVLLGTGTGVPSARRAPAGLLVRALGGTLLLDAGAGTATRLAQAGASLATLDAVLFSHLHVDHVGDLGPMLSALRNPQGPTRSAPLRLYGPTGFADHLVKLRALHGRWVEPRCAVDVHELAGGERLALGPFTVEPVRVEHAPDLVCLGYRVRSPGPGAGGRGRVLAYSGDARPCEALVALLRGADLAVVECTFPDGGAGKAAHLEAAQAGAAAARAGVPRLVLTHLSPAADAARPLIVAQVQNVYRGEIIQGEDGAVITL
jgi:ribonuclease BN (tRNA processing enzyme)